MGNKVDTVNPVKFQISEHCSYIYKYHTQIHTHRHRHSAMYHI